MAEKQDEGSLGRKKSVQEYAQEYQQSADSQLPLCFGIWRERLRRRPKVAYWV